MIPRRAVCGALLLLGLSLGLCAHAQENTDYMVGGDVLGRKTFTIGGGMG
jgi:hypothetical protein